MPTLAVAAALCLANTLGNARIDVPRFTLAWTHSIEKIRWEEDWRVDGDRLVLDAARIRGTGAGMEPPPEAVLKNGVWEWHPHTRESTLHLTRSPYTADYDWCNPQGCRPLGHILPSDEGVTTVQVCAAAKKSERRDSTP